MLGSSNRPIIIICAQSGFCVCFFSKVLDDFEKLQKNFSTEISKILSLCSSSTCSGPVGVVVTTSQWSEAVEAVPSLVSDHTHLCSSPAHLVIACPIEATVRARVKMVIVCILNSCLSELYMGQMGLSDRLIGF